MHVGLQGEQQVSEQPLVHRRPLEFWDAEHRRARAGAELPALLLRHGHAPEAQVDAEVPLQLGRCAPVEGLQQRRQRAFSASLSRMKFNFIRGTDDSVGLLILYSLI